MFIYLECCIPCLLQNNRVYRVFILEGMLVVYYLVSLTGSYYFLGFVALLLVIVLDGVYVSAFRHGKEHTWFSMSTLMYTITISKLNFIKYGMDGHDCPSNGTYAALLELPYVNNYGLTVLFLKYYNLSFALFLPRFYNFFF
jgi:hypothetical protein